MATTARRGNRYPVLGDTPDIPRDIGNLAADLDDAPAYNRGTGAARPGAGRFVGDWYWVTDDFTMSTVGSPTVWNGASWQYACPPSGPAVGIAGTRSLGYGALQALPGNDPTVTNARTPLAHAASHLQGGSDKIHGVVPLGGQIDYWGGSDPADTDWYVPDGRALNSVADTTLAALYALIGTAHGGTGASNFFLPNPRGRFMIMQGVASPSVPGGTTHAMASKGGEESHVISAAEDPDHTHDHTSNTGLRAGFLDVIAPSDPILNDAPSARGFYTHNDNPGASLAIEIGNPGATSIERWIVTSSLKHASGTPAGHNTLPPFMTCNKLMRVR